METLHILDQFRKAGKYCDVTVTDGNKEFSVHRNVLAACSPLLDAELMKCSHLPKVKVALENLDPSADHSWIEDANRLHVQR